MSCCKTPRIKRLAGKIRSFLDRLEFYMMDHLFTEADIRGICGVGQGTKDRRSDKIGNLVLVSNRYTHIHPARVFIVETSISGSNITFARIRPMTWLSRLWDHAIHLSLR